MAVIIDTPLGSLVVASAYCPSAVDLMGEEDRTKVNEQHLELNALATSHNFAVLAMDGNETVSKGGRLTFKQRIGEGGEHIGWEELGTASASCKASGAEQTTMACYCKNMKDIAGSGHTHEQPGTGGKTKVTSKIDYKWISKNLLHRVESCELVDDTRLWGKKATLSYHRALLTTIKWPGIWNIGADREPGTGVQGSPIPLGPDMAKLDQDKEEQIAKLIEQTWAKSWDTIRGT